MYGILVILVCGLLLTLQTAAHERGAARRYCGDKLTSSLSLLCNGYYKRVVPLVTDYSDYEEPPAESTSPFRQRSDVLSMTRNRRFRQRRGVASECCHKACTVSELMTYCGKLED